MDDEIIAEFLAESHESLDKLDQDLVDLEADPTDRSRLDGVFRTIHTIKGTCGFLGFQKLEALAHIAENLLSLLRDGTLVATPDIVNALLATLDAVRSMLAAIDATGGDGDENYAELKSRLTQLQSAPTTAADAESAADEAAVEALTSEPKPSPPASSASNQIFADYDQLDAEIALALAAAERARLTDPSAPTLPAEPEPALPGVPEVSQETVTSGSDSPLSAAKSDAGKQTRRVTETSIRVDVNLLDKLMNLVGELVLARNQILQFTAKTEDSEFLSVSQRLSLITGELQEGVMKTRMQPIGRIWGKYPRVVRDLARHCAKEVRLEMVGEDTELDRTLVEAIGDPLTHLVRNSVDHGIEMPDVRREKGKPTEGCLTLRAFHEGGQVNIEIADDGAGIDRERVRDKAIERGLVDAARVGRMSDRELVNLLFLPGFSTAEKVTNVSGRGVGMDVVKTNIEKIGGTIDVQTRDGLGTTFKIKIPLTLAIVPALIIESDNNRYAIPQVSLQELVRLEADGAKGVEYIHGAPVYRLRGQLLPLVYLDEMLGRGDGGRTSTHVVVLEAEQKRFGLVVDAVRDTQEIVVKPLGTQLSGIDQFAGATILGDGRVALILDVHGLAHKGNVLGHQALDALARSDEAARADAAGRGLASLLVCRSPDDGRMALALESVARIEEVPRSSVESAGDVDVVQYRGEILPLVFVNDVIPERRTVFRGDESTPQAEVEDLLQVIVHTRHGRSVGLVVDQILDVSRASLHDMQAGTRFGVSGCLVIDERVTELLDLDAVVRTALPSFFTESYEHGSGVLPDDVGVRI